MSMFAAAGRSNAAIVCPAPGVSKEYHMIMKILESISDERRIPVSFAWRDLLLGEVREIIQDCSNEGWDGYNAEPISDESGFRAEQLVRLLPEGIQPPKVIPEPTGDIALEWSKGKDTHFTLGIGDGTLVYAGIFGGSRKKYGEEQFSQELPQETLGILTSYFSEA